MSAKANFLKSYFGDAIRPIKKGVTTQSMAREGLLILSPFLGGDYYFLVGQISWKPDEPTIPPIAEVTVPRGFVTDLTSIPRILWSILPRDGSYARPAIIHDYHYWVQDKRWPRKVADNIFRVGMKELKVSAFKVSIIYYAVSWLGGRAWQNNERLKTKKEGRILRDIPTTDVEWANWKIRPNAFLDVP